MNISPLQRAVNAADLSIERLAGNANVSQTGKVAELARQFEAVLLRQILGEAQKKMIKSTTQPQSVADDIYRDMVTNQLADQISRSGEFGLARVLEKDLQHTLKTPDSTPIR